MYGVILTAHGNFSSGLYSGLKLIAGEMEQVRVCDFVDGDGFDQIDAKISAALDELKDYEGVLILTDLAGGTPFNRSVMLTNGRPDAMVFSGMNFQMLYTATMAMGDIKEVRDQILEEGKNGVVVFEHEVETATEDESDGI